MDSSGCLLFVIFNHLKGYVLFRNASGIKQAFYMVISVLTKINVPLFFIVSGALLLDRQENILTVLKKRISRMVLVTLLFELGIYIECKLYALARGKDYEFTAKRFLYGVLERSLDETGAYWYLYAYLGFLLLLPLMQKLARQMRRSDFYTLFILHFAMLSLFPVCDLLLRQAGYDGLSTAEEFSVPLATTAAFFYLLTGYYIDRKTDIRTVSKKTWAGLFAAALAGIGISCLCVYADGAAGEEYLTLFDYLLAESFMPSLFASFGWCAVSMFLGGGVTWILKKPPLFRKIL